MDFREPATYVMALIKVKYEQSPEISPVAQKEELLNDGTSGWSSSSSSVQENLNCPDLNIQDSNEECFLKCMWIVDAFLLGSSALLGMPHASGIKDPGSAQPTGSTSNWIAEFIAIFLI